MIDVVALRSLQELARCGSVAQVAQTLGFTPSAVSQQLKKLEHQVGVQLTQRKGRGLLLTAHGVALANKATDVFDALADASAAARDISVSPRGAVRLGGFATACRNIIAPTIAALRTQAPELVLTGQEINPELCVEAVASGHLDVGIVHNWDNAALHVPADVDTLHLGRDAAKVLAPATSHFAHRDTVHTDELLDVPWVTHSGIQVCRAMFNQLFADAPHLPKVVFSADEYATQLALVQAGLAYAIFPQLALSSHMPGVVALDLTPHPPSRGILAIWRRAAGNSAALEATRAELVCQSNKVLDCSDRNAD